MLEEKAKNFKKGNKISFPSAVPFNPVIFERVAGSIVIKLAFSQVFSKNRM